VRQPTDNESRYQGTKYILTSANKGVSVEHLKNPSREPAIDDCKPQGTHKNLGLVSRIHGLKLMERDLLKGEH
jgi:hypothetical protein